METPPRPAAPPPATNQFDRAARLTLLGVLALAVVTAATTIGVLRFPGDGWLVVYDTDPPQLSYFYGNWPTVLRAGDKILAVDETPLKLLVSLKETAPARADWQVGATVTYRVQRGGQTLEVPVTLGVPDAGGLLRAMAATASDAPAEWSWPLIALVVFWQRPRSRAAQLLLVAMVSHAAVVKIGWATTTISLYFAPAPLLLAALFLTGFWAWVFWPAIIWLVLSFPQPVWPETRWPRAVPLLLFGLPLAVEVSMLLTGWTLLVAVVLVGELLLLLAALGLAGASAYRPGADAVVRAQANWVLLGFAVSLGLVLVLYLLQLYWPAVAVFLPAWLSPLVTLALPICLGVAILRYRLFDINIIIRRTLQYALLTVILALVYGGLVVVLESALRPLTGHGQNQAAIVLSTLAIAALFGPLRRRVQTAIDRRFDRRRYDAARTLAAFGAEARAETDLAALEGHLTRVIDETMRPTHASVWLRPTEKQ